MASTLRNSRDFGTSKDQLEEEITPLRTIAEDRNAIRAATPTAFLIVAPRGWARGARG